MGHDDDAFLYQIDEKILCYHGPIIYEAKIIKTEYLKEQGPYYLVHYIGWKQTWDEWVPQYRVLKYNEENLKKQQQIMGPVEKKSKPAIKKKAGVDEKGEKGKKRKRDHSLNNDDGIKKSKIIIDLPEALRAFMVHDSNNIKSRMFVPLPRKPTVSDIINDYRAWRCEKYGNKDSCHAEEIIMGVHFYFNRCLGTRLLYQLERHQYKEMREKFKHLDNSQIYGAEHLLRLFGKWDSLIYIV
ncbi:7667_t:CDS:2 [Cetraspora pellucida]|uniref:Chromatin modification-related protein EAF3 n=1 Tax=Cetraspora pellucida TaxID=1433469 RepID=A0A9N8WHX2_9GLOM|nr:7667_t:CDS:2 [Cetraspora pellucida]